MDRVPKWPRLLGNELGVGWIGVATFALVITLCYELHMDMEHGAWSCELRVASCEGMSVGSGLCYRLYVVLSEVVRCAKCRFL
jgi:hypothetical protein